MISVCSVRGSRFLTVTVCRRNFNFSFQRQARLWWLNNIGDTFSQYDDGLIFAIQLWRFGFSVEPDE